MTSVASDISPIVSVIVSVYNVEAYLRVCLDSLVSQTLKEIEIICVDDGSTDSSLTILQSYAARDSRIHIIHQKNEGLSIARNVGIEKSRAPYIMFCDSDDSYEPCMCEKMVKIIECDADIDLGICGVAITYEADRKLRRSDEYYYKVKYEGKIPLSPDVIERIDVSAWNKIYRRSLIEKHHIRFPEKLKFEDAYFKQVYCSYAANAYFIRDKLYHYRRREGSIMNRLFKREDDMSIHHILMVMKLWEHYKEKGTINIWREHLLKLVSENFILALRYSSGSRSIETLRDVTTSFLCKENIGEKELSKKMQSLLHDLRAQRTKLWGLFRMSVKHDKFIFSIFGIPFLKKHTKEQHYEWRICGIRVKKLKYC